MAKTYDLKLVACTVGGVAINGYGENDAIGIEWDADLVTPTVTADGDTIYNRTNQGGCTVTVTLSQKSRAVLLLSGLLTAQHGFGGLAPPIIAPLPFFFLDPATGDSIASGECVFMNLPAPSKGKTIGEVQYRMHLPNPKPVFGAANVI